MKATVISRHRNILLIQRLNHRSQECFSGSKANTYDECRVVLSSCHPSFSDIVVECFGIIPTPSC